MKINVKMEGGDKVIAALRAKAARAQADAGSVARVGYSAPHALFVHENLEAYHANGQAKFLETPMRTGRQELFGVIAEAVRRGGTLRAAKLASAARLLSLSQPLVPVQTGELKNSGFVREG